MILGRPRVFFDIQIGKQKTGRVALELVSRVIAYLAGGGGGSGGSGWL